jgi:Flp pilus assembly pilin Flp
LLDWTDLLGGHMRPSGITDADMPDRGTVWRMRRSRGNEGATAAEYGLLVGLVVLVLVFGVDAFKLALALFYGGLQGDVDGWVP